MTNETQGEQMAPEGAMQNDVAAMQNSVANAGATSVITRRNTLAVNADGGFVNDILASVERNLASYLTAGKSIVITITHDAEADMHKVDTRIESVITGAIRSTSQWIKHPFARAKD